MKIMTIFAFDQSMNLTEINSKENLKREDFMRKNWKKFGHLPNPFFPSEPTPEESNSKIHIYIATSPLPLPSIG